MIRIDGKEIPEVQVFTYDVQEQVNNLNFQIVQLQGQISTLNQQLGGKQNEIDSLENQVAALKQQIADLQAGNPQPEPEPEPEPNPEPNPNIEYLINKLFAGVTIDPNPSKPSEKIFTQLDSAIKAVPYASYHNVAIMNGSVPNVAEVKEFNGKQALVTTLKSATSSHSRVQSEIVVKQSASPDKIHSKFNMWIHPDYDNLKQLSKVVWVDIWECWFTNPKERCSIYLDSKNGQLAFRWTSDVDDGSWTKRHPDQFSTKTIPLGQWIEFEVIWEKQTNRNRLLINGETFLDFIGKNDNKGPASYFQPLKHYVGSSVFNWMNSRGYDMTIAYADYKLIK